MFCKKYKSKVFCLTCAVVGKEVYVCHSQTGRDWYIGHREVEHRIVAWFIMGRVEFDNGCLVCVHGVPNSHMLHFSI